MNAVLCTARADAVRTMTLPLFAIALALGAASVVRAAPRSDMVTPGYKPCAQRQGVARTAPLKAPASAAAAVAFPDRGHLPPSTHVAVAAPQCATKAMS